jgi:hypothetical protein
MSNGEQRHVTAAHGHDGDLAAGGSSDLTAESQRQEVLDGRSGRSDTHGVRTEAPSDATQVLRKLAVRAFVLAGLFGLVGEATLAVVLTLVAFGLLFARVS